MKKFVLIALFGLVTLLPSNTAAAGSTTNTDINTGQVKLTNDGNATYLSTQLAQSATTSGNSGSSSSTTTNPDELILPTGFARDITSLLASLLSVIIALIAVLVFVYLVWGGVDWITSGGDKGKTDQARSKIVAAIIGLIIVAASYAILQLLVRFLGYSSLIQVFQGIKPISGEGGVEIFPT